MAIKVSNAELLEHNISLLQQARESHLKNVRYGREWVEWLEQDKLLRQLIQKVEADNKSLRQLIGQERAFIYPTEQGWQCSEGTIVAVVGHLYQIGEYWVEDVFMSWREAADACVLRDWG